MMEKETLLSELKAANGNPERVVELAVMAHYEYDVDYAYMIDEGIFDVNLRGHWPNDSGCETTLLLSAVEYRECDTVQELLERGADVTARDAHNMGVIDTLIWGHGHDCTQDVDKMKLAVFLWHVIEQHNPPRMIVPVTSSEVHNSFGYKHHPDTFKELMDLVASCTVIE